LGIGFGGVFGGYFGIYPGSPATVSNGAPEPPEIRLKRAEIFDSSQEYFLATSVSFTFSNDSLVCDGTEFFLDLYFGLSDPHASWDVISVELVGNIQRVGDPQKTDFSTESRVRVKLKWFNENEVEGDTKSQVTIKIEASSSSVISPGRSTQAANVRIKCRG
jgi:hypothetical protein